MILKVMTYNILDGGIDREQELLEVIQSIQPDVAVLQEVYTLGFLQKIGDALNMKAFFMGGNRGRRVGILSRLPIRSISSHYPNFPIWRNVIEAEIEYQSGKTFHLFGVHPKANLGVLSEWWRLWEAKYILKRMRPQLDKPCLIVGDFNAIAPNDSVIVRTMPKWLRATLWLQGNRTYHFSIQKYISSGFVDSFRHLNQNEDGFTLPPPFPNARLDYIFVNDVFMSYLKACWVVRKPSAVERASDHYPVVAEFEFE